MRLYDLSRDLCYGPHAERGGNVYDSADMYRMRRNLSGSARTQLCRWVLYHLRGE